MSLPGPEHLIFIPGVLLIGITIGWILGGRSAMNQAEARRKRARD